MSEHRHRLIASDPDANIPPREDLPQHLFIFPLSQNVILPGMVVPLSIPAGPRAASLERAQSHSDYLGFLLNLHPEREPPSPADLAPVGTIGKLVRLSRTPDGGYHILIRSLYRFRTARFLQSEHLIAQVTYVDEPLDSTDETQALWRNIQRALASLADINPQIPRGLIQDIIHTDHPGQLADLVAAHFPLPTADKQRLLEIAPVHDRLLAIYDHLVREMDLMQLGNRIQEQIREKIEQSQREFFLREQLKAIRTELGEERDEKGLNIESFEGKIAESGLPKEAAERAQEQLDRLRILTPEAAEYNMIRTYLEWLVELPWSRQTADNLDLSHAETILDHQHYGLKDVKERIIEFLAVKKLKPDQRGQIICFLGPPGVGKTSLGRSITEALGREFFRFSLGGMRDEAEIKGHRRTYIGAMPGKIIQGLKRVNTRNPVFVLDEIDKLGSDQWRGDPSSAMLEVLDPEQNHAFLDHYLDVPFDLSQVMFIATANNTSTIPQPLLDRMEIIEIPGYIEQEKVEIARRHLVRIQRDKHGLQKEQLSVTVAALRKIVRDYTREAGVRHLDQLIAKLCRKVAAKIAKDQATEVKIGPDDIEAYLGPPQYIDEMISRGQAPGIAAGLAWTPVGGEVLFVETTKMPGRGRLKLTGKLGDVMSESVQIAFSYVRANAHKLGIEPKTFDEAEFHVHFPAGAVPKDGPSAGITVVTSILSLLRQRSVPARLAMTGEITLMGNVLPVGGIKEKVIAARRAGARRVILPQRNQKDLVEVPEHVARGLQFYFVDTYADVERIVFAPPEAAAAQPGAAAPSQSAPAPARQPPAKPSLKRKRPHRGPARHAPAPQPPASAPPEG
jgi:ATP-dependent Lon protease